MAKHRKTRQEKMVADHRHITYHLETNSAQEVINTEKKPVSLKPDLAFSKTNAISYSYVKADLQKTLIVTSLIIIAQIFLFFILNRI